MDELGLGVEEREQEPAGFSEELEEDPEPARGYGTTLDLMWVWSSVCLTPLPPLLLLLGRTGALPPWLAGAVGDALKEGRAALPFFRTSLDCVGGRVRCARITGGSGEHSFPSKTGGGPVRLLGANELSLEALGLFFTAHFGARLELLLLIR